jgi:hypothetical protein
VAIGSLALHTRAIMQDIDFRGRHNWRPLPMWERERDSSTRVMVLVSYVISLSAAAAGVPLASLRTSFFSFFFSLSPRWRSLTHQTMGELVTIHVQAPLPSATATAVEVPYETVLAHPERYYQAADIVWVMAASAMVFLMVPALSLIFAGLSNRSFAMTMFKLPLMTAAVVGLQWVFWGYSLTFTDGTLWYGGETRANALVDTIARPIAVGTGEGPPIPELLYVLYEGMFASFTYVLAPALFTGLGNAPALPNPTDSFSPNTGQPSSVVESYTALDPHDS